MTTNLVDDPDLRGTACLNVQLRCSDCPENVVVRVDVERLVRGLIPAPRGWTRATRVGTDELVWRCPSCP